MEIQVIYVLCRQSLDHEITVLGKVNGCLFYSNFFFFFTCTNAFQCIILVWKGENEHAYAEATLLFWDSFQLTCIIYTLSIKKEYQIFLFSLFPFLPIIHWKFLWIAHSFSIDHRLSTALLIRVILTIHLN